MNDTHEPLSSEGDLSEDHVQQYAWNDYDPTAAWESGAGPDLSSGMDSSMAEPSSAEPGTDQMYPQVDEQMLVGKRVRALYPYSAQNEDELDLVEYEELQVISADEKDWVTATNANGTVMFFFMF